MTTRQIFAAAGWTRAGGMWGEAEWLQLSPSLVASVTDAFNMPPENPEEPAVVHLYRGPFDRGWKPAHGEAPICEMDPREYDAHLQRRVFPSLQAATAYVALARVGLEQVGEERVLAAVEWGRFDPLPGEG
jgi:hypothetical protein